MATSPARVVLEYLRYLGVFGTPSGPTPWKSVVGPLPKDGDYYVGVVDAGGIQQGRIARTGDRGVKPRVQAIVRSPTYPEGWDKVKEIESAFDKVGVPTTSGGAGQVVPVIVGNENYDIRGAYVQSPAMPLGKELDTGRLIFSVNVLLVMERTTPSDYRLAYPTVFG